MTKLKLCQLVFAMLSICPLLSAQQLPANELLAWCIVPFDNQNRTPHERVDMLQRLGIKQYAYDWRNKHLPEMTIEWRLAQKRGIEIAAVWMWLDKDLDRPDQLSDANELILRKIEETQLHTQLWVGFQEVFFEDLDRDESLKIAKEMLTTLLTKVDTSTVKIALYNHGGWLGEPQNQVDLIRIMPDWDIGIIYNFHHAHEQLADFSKNIDLMLPYLWTVNLNGMRKDGPKILPLGQGNLEKEMIETLLNKNYSGPFGILGHVDDADVEIILRENLAGYRKMWTK